MLCILQWFVLIMFHQDFILEEDYFQITAVEHTHIFIFQHSRNYSISVFACSSRFAARCFPHILHCSAGYFPLPYITWQQYNNSDNRRGRNDAYCCGSLTLKQMRISGCVESDVKCIRLEGNEVKHAKTTKWLQKNTFYLQKCVLPPYAHIHAHTHMHTHLHI